MNYLFLDLSTASTGWCAANDKDNKMAYGCIQSASANILKRMQVMATSIAKLIEEYKIDKIIAEDVHLDGFKNTHTYKVLTQLSGVVLVKAFEVNPKIQYDYMLPNSWRSKIGIHTGRGIKRETLKKEDIKYVFDKYGITVNDDVADAIALKDGYFNSKGIIVGFDWS